MKNPFNIFAAIVTIVTIAIIAYLGFTITLPGESEIIDESGQEESITGIVYENVIETPVDGNNFLMVDVENGRVLVLYEEGGRRLPDMQEQQCNNNELVAQTAQSIQAGDTVDIFGVRRTDDYFLDVCSSSDYSITVLESASDSDNGEDEMQATRQVTGEVTELIGDCAFDGNCAYVVQTDSGEEVTVIWAEGMSPICQNDSFQGGDTDIQVGDSIDSLGRVIDASTTSACGDLSYYIRKTS